MGFGNNNKRGYRKVKDDVVIVCTVSSVVCVIKSGRLR